MKILFAGGGTAGHINPALAIAGYVKSQKPNAEILFVGSKGGMEETLVPKAGFPFRSVTVSGFLRKLNWHGITHNLVAVKRIFSATAESKRIIREFQPDICVGTGGYVCGPVLRKAARMGIPVLVHESNAFPGVTTKMLAKDVTKILVAMEDAKKRLDARYAGKVEVTGNPVRQEMIFADKNAARKKLGLDSRPVILSIGGSLGAEQINRAVAEVISVSAKDDRYQHIHAYGKYGGWFPELLREKGVELSKHPNLDVREYMHNMPDCMAAADLVICRAGAMTVSELQILGKAAILIPSPNVAENHQYYNARSLSDRKAGVLIEEKDLTGKGLCHMVEEILSDPELLREYGRNAQKLAIIDANERIYRIILDSVRKTG